MTPDEAADLLDRLQAHRTGDRAEALDMAAEALREKGTLNLGEQRVGYDAALADVRDKVAHLREAWAEDLFRPIGDGEPDPVYGSRLSAQMGRHVCDVISGYLTELAGGDDE